MIKSLPTKVHVFGADAPPRIKSGIMKDKPIKDKSMHNPNDDKQNYSPYKMLGEKFGLLAGKSRFP